jgi:hypothetical protein
MRPTRAIPLRLALSSLLLLILALSGCGGGSDGVSAESGQVIVGLTDAEDSYATYTVEVVSLRLERADGTLVETLPLQPRVDFAQYVELTEFLTAATVPNGIYTRVHLTLDFTDSDIRIDVGDRIVPLDPLDTDGNALGIAEIAVRLADDRPLRVRPGLPAHMTLDFDLQASNEADIDAGTVTVSPFVLADVDPEEPKIHRVRGPLAAVDVDAGTLEVGIRPFHLRRGDFGRLQVSTDPDTVFEIDGVGYTGAAGLAELAARPVGTATVALGELVVPDRVFTATEIYAGSSVALGTTDVVTGSVVERSGEVLRVRGATLVRADGSFLFNDEIEISLGPDTLITRQLDPGSAVDASDLSVGQRIRAFGELDDSGAMPRLDVGEGLVRLLLTRVAGTLTQSDAGLLVLELQTVNRRAVSLYDFGGTGSDPAAYRIEFDGLTPELLVPGAPVAARGFPVAFGAAVSEDFEAVTVVDLQASPAVLAVDWEPATDGAFAALEPDGVILSLDGVGDLHAVFRGGVANDLLDLPSPPSLVPDASDRGLFAVFDDGSIALYTSFASFAEGLAADLGEARLTDGLLARGRWDDPTAVLETRAIAVRLR